jgi:DNA-binding NtrC family response regulator
MNSTTPNKKVLVVDDEALIRMSMSDMFEELGWASLEAGNADEAFALLERDPGIALMVADLQLPGMSGEELVRRTRKLHPELKVIVATGHAPERYASRPEFAGVAFLGKPFDLEALRRAVEAI